MGDVTGELTLRADTGLTRPNSAFTACATYATSRVKTHRLELAIVTTSRVRLKREPQPVHRVEIIADRRHSQMPRREEQGLPAFTA